jgi:hypothetical protein
MFDPQPDGPTECFDLPKLDQSGFRRCLTNKEYGLQSPCFSFGIPPICLPNYKGFGFDLSLKLALKTPILLFKGLTEFIDPNIKLAKFIYDLLKALGVCIPLPFISLFGLLPSNVFVPIGFGPPLTPFGFGYLALLLESFLDLILPPWGSDGEKDPEVIDAKDCLDLCGVPVY